MNPQDCNAHILPESIKQLLLGMLGEDKNTLTSQDYDGARSDEK